MFNGKEVLQKGEHSTFNIQRSTFNNVGWLKVIYHSERARTVEDRELILFSKTVPTFADGRFVNCRSSIDVAFINHLIDQDGVVFDKPVRPARGKMVNPARLEHGYESVDVFEHARNFLFQGRWGNGGEVVAFTERIPATDVLAGIVGLLMNVALGPNRKHHVGKAGAVQSERDIGIEILRTVRGGGDGIAGTILKSPNHASATAVGVTSFHPTIRDLRFVTGIKQKHGRGITAILIGNRNQHARFIGELEQ